MKPETFSWCAFDPNHWNHHYAAGQQIRFYRVAPWHEAMDGLREVHRPGLVSRIADHINAFVHRGR